MKGKARVYVLEIRAKVCIRIPTMTGKYINLMKGQQH